MTVANQLFIYTFLRYAIMGIVAIAFLLPLYVMVATSLKDMDQIRMGNLLSLPTSIHLDAWQTAWDKACTGVECNGLKPFFISTAWGAINGYVLSFWKFKGADTIFGLLLFGVFMPFQVVLLPMSQVLGWMGLSSSIKGLILVHCLAGLASTTLFFRNYYAGLPQELIQAARLDGAGFWQIFWRIVIPMSTPIVMVTLIWQFTNIWNDFLFGVAFTGADSKPVTVGLNNLANTTSSVKFYNIDMAAAMIAALPTIAIYVLAGKFFVRGLTAGAVKG
jgi:glucose/mannose transport system permease protein